MKLLLLCVSLVILVGSSPAYGDRTVCIDGVTTELTDEQYLQTISDQSIILGACEIEDELPPFDIENAVIVRDRDKSWVDDIINDTRGKQLEYDNKILQDRIVELETKITGLELLVMEQLKVIQKWVVEGKEKIDFLENALAQRNLEYEWLTQVTDQILSNSN